MKLFLKMTVSQSDERQNASIRHVLEGAGLAGPRVSLQGRVPLAGHGATLANGAHPQVCSRALRKSDTFAQ